MTIFGFHFYLMSSSSRLEDSSEQVKRELARVVGQLSCLQSDTSHLSGIQSSSELLCQTLSLASEHAETTIPSLRASFAKPFLPLLAQQSPSSVKQGILIFSLAICSSKPQRYITILFNMVCIIL